MQKIERLREAAVLYDTRPIEVSVRFSKEGGVVDTKEGPVSYAPGDPILTGVEGESWAMGAEKFHTKYRQAPASAGPDRYVKRPAKVHAVRLTEPFTVSLAGGRGNISGPAGSWCVWYGPGDVAIVDHEIFVQSYTLATIPVYIQIGPDINPAERAALVAELAALREFLPHTELAVVDEVHESDVDRTWFKIVRTASAHGGKVKRILEIGVGQLLDRRKPDNLYVLLRRNKRARHWLAFSFRQLWHPSSRDEDGDMDEAKDDASLVADQLCAIDWFNECLNDAAPQAVSSLVTPAAEGMAPQGADRVLAVGDVADAKASLYQEKWQRLAFGTPKEIAAAGSGGLAAMLALMLRLSLTSLGIWGALGLVAYTELAEGCRADDALSFMACNSHAWHSFAGLAFFFGLYLPALIYGWIRYARAKVGKWQDRHFDLRFLAECLRVQYVLHVIGKDTCAAGFLPLMHHAESSWVRLSLHSLFHAQCIVPRGGDAHAALDWADKAFVVAQLTYHEGTLIKRRKDALAALKRWSRWWGMAFLPAILVLACNLVVRTYHTFWPAGQEEALEPHGFLSPMKLHFIVILQILSLACWGALRKVAELFGLEQEIQRGLLVQHHLEVAKEKKSGDPEQELMTACGHFIFDQAVWHAMHRGKPIDVATGS